MFACMCVSDGFVNQIKLATITTYIHTYLFFQLPVHPVNDEYIQYILSLAFRHFKLRDSYAAAPSAASGEIIAVLYAEVISVLAQACFLPVRKRFVAEFKEHQNNPSSFVNIIYGMKYLRIKVCTVVTCSKLYLCEMHKWIQQNLIF